jgi:hypothetical protein
VDGGAIAGHDRCVDELLFAPTALRAQAASWPDEIPIERCLLLDTGATTVLNMKFFAGGRIKQIPVTSWARNRGHQRA